jgi:hypothetical protein
MRTFARFIFGAALVLSLPAAASAQTSAIAGTVKDTSGAVLPGVTVEASSPALIEKVRSAVTDGSGVFQITTLRPGVYTVTFTLPGFSVVKRENVELTSDFTATINTELRVGAVAETITVSAESPVVDTQSITTRTVMTREVLDAIPTGRNIQAVGIMIPGTTIAQGGGGALSRDVGGSGNLQQSPLQYRGSPDTVQTIEGMRLNNLCANGAYSGVYWNDGSFQEISYVTGADSAEMGQGGIRVNMVPRDGGNAFHGVMQGNYAGESFASDNCGFTAIGQPCQRAELYGDTTYNLNNKLSNVSNIKKIYDFNPSLGGPIKRDKVWFYATYRYWGVDKTVADSFFDADPSPIKYAADFSRPGVDDGHIRSIAVRLTAQVSGKDKISYYHDDQNKVRGHWGIAAAIPPEASAIQATPTSFVSVTKWTRTQSNRMLIEGGLSVYNQQYIEMYQPEVFASSTPVKTIFDQSTAKFAGAWPNPGDHYSKLFTESASLSYVTGSHSFKFGGAISEGRWRLIQQFTGDVGLGPSGGATANNGITYNNGVPVSVTLRIPTDRRNSIKFDTGLYAQDRWTIKRATINGGVRFDWFQGATLPEELPASSLNPAQRYDNCPDGLNSLQNNCTGRVQNWKDIAPRLGVSFDVFGNGRTAVKTSIARYVNGQQIAVADNANPESTVGTLDTRAWRDIDANGSPFDTAGNLQFNELTPSAVTPNFGKNIATTTLTDPKVLNGWGVRGFNWEYTASLQHELAPRVSVSGGYYRRWFGNQTVNVDQRYDLSSYDGPFCITAPANPNLPNGGGYQVCGLYDLKPALVSLPARSLIQHSSNFGGETNIFQGYEVSTIARFKQGAFVQAGVNASKRIFDQCNLVDAGVKLMVVDTGTPPTGQVAEIYSDGSRACHQVFGYRPDVKLLGSYTLPWDVQFSGTYQFSRGVQNGTVGGNSILATWAVPNAIVQQGLGRALSAGAASKSVNLIQAGTEYGDNNLNQLDLRLSKRFRIDQYRVRFDFDIYNLFNSNWPFAVTNAFSTAATSGWLRPTNVLQSRFFKIGGQFDF